jgi:hypothetical protein
MACGGSGSTDSPGSDKRDEAACSEQELGGLLECARQDCADKQGQAFGDCVRDACFGSFFAGNSCVECVKEQVDTDADTLASACTTASGPVCPASATKLFECAQAQCASITGDALGSCIEDKCADFLFDLGTAACEECVQANFDGGVAGITAGCPAAQDGPGSAICADSVFDDLAACAASKCTSADGFAECMADNCSDTDLGSQSCEICIDRQFQLGPDSLDPVADACAVALGCEASASPFMDCAQDKCGDQTDFGLQNCLASKCQAESQSLGTIACEICVQSVIESGDSVDSMRLSCLPAE